MSRLKLKIDSLVKLLRKDNPSSEVARKASGVLIARLSGTALTFFSQIILARIMGEENFGEYIYIWSWITTLVIFGKFGFDVAAIRFVSDYRANEQWGLLRGFIKRSRQIVIISSIVAISIISLIIFILKEYQVLTYETAFLFWFALPLLPIMGLMQVHSGMLQGASQVVISILIELVTFPLLLTAFSFSFWLVSSSPASALIVIISNICAALIVLFIQDYVIRTKLPSLTNFSRLYSNRDWLDAAISMSVTSGAYLIINRMDILVIGTFIGTTEAGIYSIATRLVQLVHYGLQVMNTASAYKFSELFSQGKKKELQEVVFLTTTVTFISTIPIMIVLLLGADWILNLFGKAFISGMPLLQILMIGELVNVLTGPNGLLMNMTGHHREIAVVLIITIIFDAFLMYWLVPILGVRGAAIATAGSNFIRNLIIVIQVRRKLGINTTIFSKSAWTLIKSTS